MDSALNFLTPQHAVFTSLKSGKFKMIRFQQFSCYTNHVNINAPVVEAHSRILTDNWTYEIKQTVFKISNSVDRNAKGPILHFFIMHFYKKLNQTHPKCMKYFSRSELLTECKWVLNNTECHLKCISKRVLHALKFLAEVAQQGINSCMKSSCLVIQLL